MRPPRFSAKRDRRIRIAAALVALVIAAVCIGQAAWIHVKARLAQVLIEAAWQRTLAGKPDAKPWPWSDTRPIARLVFREQARKLMVLEGSSGRNLAFGPTHDAASVLPGARGNSVIAGHRDTHFALLRHLVIGEPIRADLGDGRSSWFAVSSLQVVDSRRVRVGLDADTPRLTLVTCYPFDAVDPGGPLRFVVTADWVASTGNAPP